MVASSRFGASGVSSEKIVFAGVTPVFHRSAQRFVVIPISRKLSWNRFLWRFGRLPCAPEACAEMPRRRALLDGSPYLFLVLSTAVRLAAGLVLLKYLAWQFGPSTFGLLTQVMGVAAIFYMFAGGGITNGVIRNISATSSELERRRWMSAGTTVTVVFSIALAGIAAVFALFGARAIFGDPAYAPVFVGIAAAQILVGFGNLVLAYFSGIGDNRTFATIQIVANILSLLLLIALTAGVGLGGAVLGLVVAPATIGAVALWRFFRRVADHGMFRITWDRPLLKNLMSYAAVMASSVTAVPIAQLLIRTDMSERLGWNAVGYWQAVAKLSDAYMLFIGVILINYLLPQLSNRHETSSALRMLLRFGLPLLGVFVAGCVAIYAVRNYLLLIVYSEQFLAAAEFLLPQLVGDTLKVATLLLYYFFMSRGRVLIVFASELTLGVALYVLYLVLAPSYGAVAPIYAYAASYAALLLVMLGLLYATTGGAKSQTS
jgi:polysaccharide transporter, PST family